MGIAVAEEGDVVASRLGRAVKFALFDIEQGIVRGPFHRIADPMMPGSAPSALSVYAEWVTRHPAPARAAFLPLVQL